jgi:hypothetical protein
MIKKKIECNSCVLYDRVRNDCFALRENADDKDGYCKFYKPCDEYKMQYNDVVGAYVPVKR